MNFSRHYTSQAVTPDQDTWSPSHIENGFVWKEFPVSIKENGRVILEGVVEAPMGWSSQAVTILAHKYLRKAGVPSATTPVKPFDTFDDVPRWLWPSMPSLGSTTGAEVSTRQVFRRLAGHWTYAAFMRGYFNDPNHQQPLALAAVTNSDGTTTVDKQPEIDFHRARERNAQIFYDEVFYALAHQMAAPNSPQWFNTGLWWAYGVKGSTSDGQIGYVSNGIAQSADKAPNIYEYPQTSACFILGLKDSLLGDGGILDTVTREARVFKYGSGSGINYSVLRAKGAALSNGGTSSGLMSFLKLFDVNAGTIKSGGTTRRAARMAIVDVDHPEAQAFAEWKAKEEVKVAAMVLGANTAAPSSDLLRSETLTSISAATFEGEAYSTVSGQNANNSLRATDRFMRAVGLTTSGKGMDDGDRAVEVRRYNKLWDSACQAAWLCGDPGFQFHDTINKWHTIPKVAEQRASNPCSEYMFIDNSSCNLASLNLIKFWINGHESNTETVRDSDLVPGATYFNVNGFEYMSKLWTTILDISVGMSSFPDPIVAENSVNYRAVGLGYANLGGLMLLAGVPYDSEEAQTYASLVTAIMHGAAWEQSSKIASELGPFYDFEKHRTDVGRVLELHRSEARKLAGNRIAGTIASTGNGHPFADCLGWVENHWCTTDFTPLTEITTIRNAQLTLLAPTGTIGLVMGCDSTGIEPVYMLTNSKKLAGGGILFQETVILSECLESLGYSEDDVGRILIDVRYRGRIDTDTPVIAKEHVRIFECANDISVDGHLNMMAAVQPFLSGAISKTVNMSSTATVADISETYIKAWKLGLKAVALYRDGCKLSQPLTANVSKRANTEFALNHLVTNQQLAVQDVPLKVEGIQSNEGGPIPYPDKPYIMGERPGESIVPLSSVATTLPNTAVVKGLPPKGAITPRYKLPARRSGFTQKVSIAGQSLYLRTGEFPDGRIGEVFLTMGRDGSTMRHFVDSLAIGMSLGLQHGVPLQEFVDAFTDSRSEPCGIVIGSDNVRMCSSIMDYVVKELAAAYLHLETAIPIVVQSPEPDGPVSITVQQGMSTNNLIADTSVDRMKVVSSVSDTEPRLYAGVRTMAKVNYTGNACPVCQAFTLHRAGSCYVCATCGETTGCS